MKSIHYEAELYVDGVWKGSVTSPDINGAIDTVLNFIPDSLEFDTYCNKLNIKVIKKNSIVGDCLPNPDVGIIPTFMNEITEVSGVYNADK